MIMLIKYWASVILFWFLEEIVLLLEKKLYIALISICFWEYFALKKDMILKDNTLLPSIFSLMKWDGFDEDIVEFRKYEGSLLFWWIDGDDGCCNSA